ncbi:MAG: hydrogenase 2 maturation endopeptidase [Gammaproteobacteria bacterium]|nr:MAG: hydrogenase 2 maturation endopeptidase [Gammaproteobacteria bacterium]
MNDKKILVLGMGNILMQDEGIGVRAVELFSSQYNFPENVNVMDGGTTGIELYNPIINCDYLIVTDAINSGDKDGSLIRIANEQIPAFFQTKLSNHQLGLSDLLALMRLKDTTPKQVILIGMVPYLLENKLGLSSQAQKNIPKMVVMIVDELNKLGITVVKKEKPDMGHWQKEEMYEKNMQI